MPSSVPLASLGAASVRSPPRRQGSFGSSSSRSGGGTPSSSRKNRPPLPPVRSSPTSIILKTPPRQENYGHENSSQVTFVAADANDSVVSVASPTRKDCPMPRNLMATSENYHNNNNNNDADGEDGEDNKSSEYDKKFLDVSHAPSAVDPRHLLAPEAPRNPIPNMEKIDVELGELSIRLAISKAEYCTKMEGLTDNLKKANHHVHLLEEALDQAKFEKELAHHQLLITKQERQTENEILYVKKLHLKLFQACLEHLEDCHVEATTNYLSPPKQNNISRQRQKSPTVFKHYKQEQTFWKLAQDAIAKLTRMAQMVDAKKKRRIIGSPTRPSPDLNTTISSSGSRTADTILDAEMLQISRKRLEDIQQLFSQASLAQRSTSPEIQRQVQLMKTDALQKYHMFLQYGQI